MEGHIVDHDSGYYVHEGIIKIFNIGDRTLVAFSGQVKLAYDFYDALVYESMKQESTSRQAFIAALGILSTEDKNELSIVACFIEDGIPILLKYKDGAISDSESIVHLGSFSSIPALVDQVQPNVEAGIEFVNRQFSQGKVDSKFHQRILVRINAILQSIGIHNPLMNIGVGGLFVSAAMTISDGFFWPRPIMYLLYTGMRPFSAVLTSMVVFLRGAVFIQVLGNDTVKAIIPDLTEQQVNDAATEYFNINWADTAATSDWIFLSTKNVHVFIGYRLGEASERWFRVSKLSDKSFRIDLSVEMDEMIFDENSYEGRVEELW